MRMVGMGIAAVLALAAVSACGGGPKAPQESVGAAAQALAPGDAFVCSMHPEVTSGSPGRCTKCGMDLVPRADTAGQSEHR